ncbi:hypothetical protein [Thalassococcus lentus]|uniref:HEAT repeat domain-containing protein n=1 Tax=Thalassococcus lentus TaxID=1210524 RepID=A0ABT4XQ26_9RHOB|nr:hypothetical protein [Thalassococcus lentus]MDA7424054.1 hypothetical protein [Thalassococcus lentus]
MRSKSHCLGLIVAGALIWVSPPSAEACAFHGYTPNPTLVDILLATEQAVIAVPDAANPNVYRPVTTLSGPSVSELPIPPSQGFLLQVVGRPDASVLLARDGAYGPWLEVAVLDDRYRALIELIMQRQSAWLYGDEKARLATFAKRVNDPSPGIRRLALRELDRAPYGSLDQVRVPKIKTLRQDLQNGNADLRPIRILLAGLSGDRSFTPLLLDGLDKAIAKDKAYLGAYATALIELEGKSAVNDIIARHLQNDALPSPVQAKLLEALAIQYKTAPAALRRYIAREAAKLVRAKPELADMAAQQFGFSDGWRITK